MRSKKPSKVELERMYIHEGMRALAIAKKIGVNGNTVGNWLRSYRIPIRSISQSMLPIGTARPSREELERMYVEKRMSAATIARRIGVNGTTVSGWLKRENIPIRSKYENGIAINGKEQPPKEELERMYVEQRMSTVEIGKFLDVSSTTVGNWLKNNGISIRSRAEAKLTKNAVKPSKLELERMYIDERMTLLDIAKESGIKNQTTVRRWLGEYNIPVRTLSESILPVETKKPSKEELRSMYIKEHKSQSEIARKLKVHGTTIRRWLGEYEIPLRTLSETALSPGVVKPSKKELERMYVKQQMKLCEIAKAIGVTSTGIKRWLKGYGIPNRPLPYSRSSNRINKSSNFVSFIANEPQAQPLAALALNLENGEASQVEDILYQMYPQRFKSKSTLHELLLASRDEVMQLIQDGVTNLGSYIGAFKVHQRGMVPLFLDEALKRISIVSPVLEDTLYRVGRSTYGPEFNENPRKTLETLSERVESAQSPQSQSVYRRLYEHYQQTLELGGLLANGKSS